MNTSGEAADQVVRMSMEVGEAALKISGEGAKQLAVLLYAILKEQKKAGNLSALRETAHRVFRKGKRPEEIRAGGEAVRNPLLRRP